MLLGGFMQLELRGVDKHMVIKISKKVGHLITENGRSHIDLLEDLC